MADANSNNSLRDQLVMTALRQGPSFVVLLLVLFGIWRVGDYLLTKGIGGALEQIKAGYREIQASHDANLREIVDAFERDEERDRTVVEIVRDVVENREILKASHEILVDLKAREAAKSDNLISKEPIR